MSRYFHLANKQPSERAINEAIDDVAELLATDRYSFADIARIMGCSRATPTVLFRMMCERLGEQAL